MIVNKVKAAFAAFLMCVGSAVYAQNFKVVLDPGHGGKDPGAMRGNFVEKKIVLDVALKVGELLKLDKDIKVIFTRKTDSIQIVIDKNQLVLPGESFKIGVISYHPKEKIHKETVFVLSNCFIETVMNILTCFPSISFYFTKVF